jgi:hypothetical protein
MMGTVHVLRVVATRSGLRKDELALRAYPLWQRGLDTYDIAVRLTRTLKRSVPEDEVANALAWLRDNMHKQRVSA